MSRTLALLSLLSLSAVAQEPPASPASKPAAPADERAARLLKEAVHNMAQLPSFTLAAKEVSKSPIGGMPDTKVTAELTVDRVQGTLVTIDDDQLAMANGRMAVKVSDQDWALRRGFLAEGQTLPFVPDLDALWTLLERAAGTATLGQPGGEGGAQQENVQLTVSEDLAREFLWSGALPSPSSGGGFAVFIAAGGGRAPANKPEVTYELTIAINPAGRLIDQITVKGRVKGGAMGGAVVMRAAGGGVQFGGQEEDEDAGDEEAAAKKKKKDKNTLSYTLAFKDHGKTKVELPTAVRKLLGRS